MLAESEAHLQDNVLPQNDKAIGERTEFMEDAYPRAAGFKVCPHCTFENAEDAGDCEVCGLPLT